MEKKKKLCPEIPGQTEATSFALQMELCSLTKYHCNRAFGWSLQLPMSSGEVSWSGRLKVVFITVRD